jgi:hypothetical protein
MVIRLAQILPVGQLDGVMEAEFGFHWGLLNEKSCF